MQGTPGTAPQASEQHSADGSVSPVLPAPAGPAAAAAAVSEIELPAAAAKPEAAAPLVVLLYGPRLAGTSTQAALLSSRHGIPAVTLDRLLLEAFEQLQARAAAGVVGAPRQQPDPQRQLYEGLSKLMFPGVAGAGAASDLPAPAAVSSASPRAHTPGSARSATVGSTAQREAAAAAAAAPQPPSPVDVAAEALRHILQQPAYQRGFVLDGVESKHLASPIAVARCVLKGVGLSCKSQQLLEPPPPPPVGKASAKGSRPVSSRPGSKPSAAAAEPATPLLMPTAPDVWEGTQLVSRNMGRAAAGAPASITCVLS